jgi:hypothetical protein
LSQIVVTGSGEPCGLTQMYAQKLGSLPIGHQTGGPSGNHHRWRNRISVRSTVDPIVSRRRPACVHNLHGERLSQLDAAERDVTVVQLKHCRWLLRRALSEDGAALN